MIRRLLGLLFLLALSLPVPYSSAATGTAMPYVKIQFFTDTGVVCNGCKLHTFAAGSSTPLATYSDASLAVISQNTNPVILDSAGRASIFLSAASYKFRLDSAADVTIWTMDNIGAVPFVNVDLDISGTAGEALTAGDAVYLSDATGGCGATAGRWYKADADLACASTTAQAIGFVPTDIASAASGSIRVAGRLTGMSGLATGSLYYISATAGAITSSAPANARGVAVADSTTSIVLALKSPDASATVAGIVSTGAQTMAGAKTWTGAAAFTSSTAAAFDEPPTYKPGAVTTADATVSGRILGPFVTSQATSGVSETSMIATPPTIKANLLNASGDVLRFTAVGVASNNAQVTTFSVKLGGTTISTFTFTPNAVAASWRLVVEIQRTGASAQNITSTLSYSEAFATTLYYTDMIVGAKDLTTALTLDCTMTRAVAGTVTFKGGWFEVIGL